MTQTAYDARAARAAARDAYGEALDDARAAYDRTVAAASDDYAAARGVAFAIYDAARAAEAHAAARQLKETR